MDKIKRFLLIVGFLGCFSLNADWMKTYGGEDYDRGHCVIETKDGGYLIVGSTESFGEGYDDVWLIKTDENGDTLWTRTYGKEEYSEGGNWVIETTDGGYAITGCTAGTREGDVWLIKTDENGDTLWTRTYGGEGWDTGSKIIETKDGGYLIVGSTLSLSGKGEDVILIKVDPTTGVKEGVENKRRHFLHIYPNPAGRFTIIKYKVPVSGEVSLRVYTADGRLVKSFVEGYKSKGIYETKWNLEGVSAGIYFLRLKTPECLLTKRLIVVR